MGVYTMPNRDSEEDMYPHGAPPGRWDFNINTLVQLVGVIGIIFSVGVAYSSISSTAETNSQKLAVTMSRLEKIEEPFSLYKYKVDTFDSTTLQLTKDINELKAALNDYATTVKLMNGNLQNVLPRLESQLTRLDELYREFKPEVHSPPKGLK